MSIISRTRKQQKRDFESRLRSNNSWDREIGIWKLIDVHEFPVTIDYNNEFDFWCHNNQDLFLLRLKKTRIKKYSISKSKGRKSVTYLIAEFDFQSINNDLIKIILKEFESTGIPRYTLSKIDIELKIINQ